MTEHTVVVRRADSTVRIQCVTAQWHALRTSRGLPSGACRLHAGLLILGNDLDIDGEARMQVVPTKKCFSTLRRAGMSSEELEEKWRRDHVFPCGTFVGMAVQVRLLPCRCTP